MANFRRSFRGYTPRHLLARCLPLLLAGAIHVTVNGPISAEEVRLPVARDNWVSTVGEEALGNNGGAARMKLKSIQEMSIVDLDPQPLRGRSIESAKLRLRIADKKSLDRITVSTITCPWTEGDGQGYAKVNGASTFAYRTFPDQRWLDSDLTAVTLGQGGSLWRSVQADTTTEPGWAIIDIDPLLVAARVAGISEGFLLMDDTGTEWKREGDKFISEHYPNRYVFSKDSNRANEPQWIIRLSDAKQSFNSPSIQGLTYNAPKTGFQNTQPLVTEADPRASLTWQVPNSQDYHQLIGFAVWCDGQRVLQAHVPALPALTQNSALDPAVAKLIIDPASPPWDISQPHTIEVAGVNAQGEFGPKAKTTVQAIAPERALTWSPSTVPDIKERTTKPDWSQALQLGPAAITVIDPLDKVLPEDGTFIPAVRNNYLATNALWDRSSKTIQLSAARGQWVGIQLVIGNATGSVQASLELPQPQQPWLTQWHAYQTVPDGKTALPDPLMPLSEGGAKSSCQSTSKNKFQSLLAEIYVPENLTPGKHAGELKLQIGKEQTTLKVAIEVWPIEMPKQLSFLPEMNCYGLPQNERDYYRAGHRHRVLVHRVPYSQSGKVTEGCGPEWNGKTLNWQAWDRRFADYFNGKAFADLPRGNVPLECFYLPLHENWPVPFDTHYRGGYWADEAMSEEYAQQWIDASRQFAEHFQQQGWQQTRFLGFLNNKVDFKKNGWARASSIWLLDEPANFQDYVALKFFGELFHAGLAQAGKPNNLMYRADISRPQWQRDSLDTVLQYNVVSQSAYREYHRLVSDRRWRYGQIVMIYGTTNHPRDNNVQALAWSWDVWCRGADGVLPWQTIGRRESWQEADQLSLFYPVADDRPPVPSVRLKAYTYGQQDAELLRFVAQKLNVSRQHLGKELLNRLPLASVSRIDARITEDAGWADYGQLPPEAFTLWRRSLIEHALR